MIKPKVILREQAGYDTAQIAEKASEIIGALSFDARGRTILVKPSFVFPSNSAIALGVITQPQFVAAVAMALKEAGAKKILIAESSILGPSRVSFEAVGILPMIKGIAEPVYLDEQDEVEVNIDNPHVQKTFKVPKIWLDADAYVSLPKIKTNMFSGITLSVKNNLGMIRQYERLKYHDWRLHKKLADLFMVRPPDMVIADCVVAGQGQGPIMAEPVELGLMVGGDNAVAADVVACHLTGYGVDEVEHLKLLIDAGCGPASIDDIEIDGVELLERARPFKRPEVSIGEISPHLKVFMGTERRCPWGCAGMVQGLMDPYVKQWGPEGIRPMNVIMGKPMEKAPHDIDPDITMVLGDCAAPYRDMGEFIPGCCPRPLDVAVFVRRIQGAMGMLEQEMTFDNLRKGLNAYSAHRLWRLKRRMEGKKVEPIENHITIGKAMREYVKGRERKSVKSK